MFLALFDLILDIVWIALFARVILSWLPIRRNNPIVNFIFIFTEPVLAPLRRVLPRFGMIDLSPLVLFFLLMFLRGIIHSIA